jgi:hypothetical protein
MSQDILAEISKDDLVLATLAALGGETNEVNERDLFLACWHAFPAVMRWVDTALPNPDTFTASLRRLDQRAYIVRVGKQKRQKRGRRAAPRRKTVLDAPGKAGVVKARIADGGLVAAGLESQVVDAVARLLPNQGSKALADPQAIAICIGLRAESGRHLDEGGLVELAFHRFPDHFAYSERPEFPDLERIRTALAAARAEKFIGEGFTLTEKGRSVADDGVARRDISLATSHAPTPGELRAADRIERSDSYQAFMENGTLVKAKRDELYRALRVPPTADPRPLADALRSRVRGLRRINKGEVADYLIAVAAKHNANALELVKEELEPELSTEGGGKR